MEPSKPKVWSWKHADESGDYLISTSSQLLDRDYINDVFANYNVSWAGRLSEEQMSLMISQSLNFGVYEVRPESEERTADSPSSPRTPSPTLEASPSEHMVQIGLARFVTDSVTFVYMTDIWIDSIHRGKGLGRWLMTCFEDVMKEMPMLRRVMLLTSLEKTKSFYEEGLGMWDIREEGKGLIAMARRGYTSS